jgi:hemerythrin-like domain-containing protein
MFNSGLSIIYDEHRSLAAVVQGLRHLVGEYRLGRMAADFSLLRAIVFYLDEFPLQLRTRTADSIIAKLRAQHAAGAGHVGALHTALERFEAGETAGMEDFSAAVELFADDILRHMALEESALIPLARRHLSGEDWVEISVAFGANGDPRFVADPERDFADLFRRVMALAPIASDRGYGKA